MALRKFCKNSVHASLSTQEQGPDLTQSQHLPHSGAPSVQMSTRWFNVKGNGGDRTDLGFLNTSFRRGFFIVVVFAFCFFGGKGREAKIRNPGSVSFT